MTTASDFLPPPELRRDLDALRRAAQGCRGCALYANATATVFGQGPASARLLLIGEQPGDQEDRQGAPFVGPAGRVLDQALKQAGIDRSQVYVTNAVKHFKWELQAGTQRRLHKKPSRLEVKACQPWLEAEVGAVHPALLGCLGATAAESVLGPGARVGELRGRVLTSPSGLPTMVTVHPSSILRGPPEEREMAMGGLVQDLAAAAQHLAGDH